MLFVVLCIYFRFVFLTFVCNECRQTYEGETALHCAVANKLKECVIVLIRHGASINLLDHCQRSDNAGNTPLHLAIDDEHIFKILLDVTNSYEL